MDNILPKHAQFMACWAMVFFVMTVISGIFGYVFVDGASGTARSVCYVFAGFLIVSLLGRIRRPYLR
jgi:uncharacterized membrane protein YtjA (UPF0391 family)